LLLIILLTSLTAPSSSKKRQVRGVKATLEAGWETVKSGRLSEGTRAFEAVLQHQPGNIVALGYLKAVLPELGKLDEAEASLTALLQAAPTSPAARLFLSVTRSEPLGTDERLAVWQRAHRAVLTAATIAAAGPRIYHGVHKTLLRAAIPSSEPPTSAALRDSPGHRRRDQRRETSDIAGIELYRLRGIYMPSKSFKIPLLLDLCMTSTHSPE
jgi:hypothetical protein